MMLDAIDEVVDPVGGIITLCLSLLFMSLLGL